MNSSGLRIRGNLAAMLILALIAAGCTQPSAFQAPVSNFRDASAVVIQSAKLYLTTLNKNERDAYIYQQVEFRRQITRTDLDKTQVFSDASIAVRTKALDQISNYMELLYNLVNSDAPTSISAKADDLQKSLTSLSTEVSGLTGANDVRFKNAIATASPIIGALLTDLVNGKIVGALKVAVNKGTQPVNDLIEAIRLDMEVEYERKRSAAGGRVTAAILEYNREFEKGIGADPGKLRSYADDISALEDQAEALRTAQPGEGLDAMRKANDALLKLATQPKPSVQDFASFVAEVESFASTAKRVGDAVQSLKQL
jgi:hypothetical protein